MLGCSRRSSANIRQKGGYLVAWCAINNKVSKSFCCQICCLLAEGIIRSVHYPKTVLHEALFIAFQTADKLDWENLYSLACISIQSHLRVSILPSSTFA